ncbi:hypothetical protein GQ53DRAFT_849731 [Thozetella sp. PMI_491]|nr:hypothetical protein GQ53DRAFT_849731 [Thozetella sp. PMI_491]
MVYQGMPSRGCGTCRQRRVKCDERKPTCFRCEKARRICTGYRSEFELMHRNENKALERRMRTTIKGEAPALKANVEFGIWIRTSSGNWDLTAGEDSGTAPRYGRLTPSLSVSLEEQASCHFASNFILVPVNGASEGMFEFLLPLISVAASRSPLRHAFRACAFASLGGTQLAEGVDLPALAMEQHSKALTQTHLALSDPQMAKSDGVVAAVMLLVLFENMMATRDMGLLAWRSHVEGAVSIIKSRGKEQFQSKTGRRLFQAVRHQLMGRILSSGIPPSTGLDWWKDDGPSASSMMSKGQAFSLKATQLRAEASRLLNTVTRDRASVDIMVEMRRRVQALDQEIATWLVSLPQQCRFKTLYWQESQGPQEQRSLRDVEVFPGRVDIYPDFAVAETWNTARAVRLILTSVIIRITAWLCTPLDYRTTPEFATSRRICEGTISDMIASIPFHLGWHTKRQELFDGPERGSFACGEDASVKTLLGHLAVWPLTTIHAHDLATDAQREYCNGRLRYIANRLGLRYAHVFADSKFRFPSMLIKTDQLPPEQDFLQEQIGLGERRP